MQSFQFLCNELWRQFILGVKQLTILSALYACSFRNNSWLPYKLDCCDYNNRKSEQPFQTCISKYSCSAYKLDCCH
ncbi:Uncharacterised protein [Klebsiella pneumoniae]|nr:Uncharacterised protein [Klebsiella pneumoniae]